MTTSQIAEEIQNQWPGWNINGGAKSIINIIDQTHRILKQNESKQNMFIDEATGDLPILATTKDLFTYTMPDDVWRVGQILIRIPLQVSPIFPIELLTLEDQIQEVSWGGLRYLNWQQVHSVESNETENAKVIFSVEPGDTTDKFRYLAYKKSKKISSTSIQLEIPDRFHWSHFLPACNKLIEGQQNGNYIEAINYIKEELLKDMQQNQNRGAQAELHRVRRREF